jgi:periplasmic divalent cation tolerance protein
MPEHFQVSTTSGSEEEARQLAHMAVEQGLAACAQVSGPVTSTFRWKGGIEVAQEWLCTLKTVERLVEQLVTAIRERHSYELPEITATRIAGGDPEYLEWIERSLSSPGT